MPPSALVPRPGAEPVAVPGRHLPDRLADLVEQGLERMAEPRIELPGRGLCCGHLTLPKANHSRYDHDISVAGRRQDITRFNLAALTWLPGGPSHTPRSGRFPAIPSILPVPGRDWPGPRAARARAAQRARRAHARAFVPGGR